MPTIENRAQMRRKQSKNEPALRTMDFSMSPRVFYILLILLVPNLYIKTHPPGIGDGFSKLQWLNFGTNILASAAVADPDGDKDDLLCKGPLSLQTSDISPGDSQAPVKFEFVRGAYGTDFPLKVTLNAGHGMNIQSFFVQAHERGQHTSLGSFNATYSHEDVSFATCTEGNSTSNTATTEKDFKTRSKVVLYWNAPAGFSAAVVFRANAMTISEQDGQMREWRGVTSQEIMPQSEECYTGDGASYRGTIAHTKSGIPCQNWNSSTPHKHTYSQEGYPDSGLDGNFCRRPDENSKPWCYTTQTSPVFEACDIPKCVEGDSLRHFVKFGEAVGDQKLSRKPGTKNLTTLSRGFPMVKDNYTSVAVFEDGVVVLGTDADALKNIQLDEEGSFGSASQNATSLQSAAAIAPFWTNVQRNESAIGQGYVYYRESIEPEVIIPLQSNANEMLRFKAGKNGDVDVYKPSWAFIATWYLVGDDPSMEDVNKLNTFQLVLLTDGNRSFVLYNYDMKKWTERNHTALIGYKSGDALKFINHSLAATNVSQFEKASTLGRAVTTQSNVGSRGQLLYEVSPCDTRTTKCLDLVTLRLRSSRSTKKNADTQKDRANEETTTSSPTTGPDLCSGVSCGENGQCRVTEDGARCVCDAGYTGDRCEIDIDECAFSNCQNGGSCQDEVNGYRCICVPGFTGRSCESDINDCLGSPCKNGGTCVDGENSYSCKCTEEYKGKNCEELVDKCKSNPCKNGASCTSSDDDYTCQCRPGFTGRQCSLSVCLDGTCKNGHPCTDQTASTRNCTCRREGSYEGYCYPVATPPTGELIVPLRSVPAPFFTPPFTRHKSTVAVPGFERGVKMNDVSVRRVFYAAKKDVETDKRSSSPTEPALHLKVKFDQPLILESARMDGVLKMRKELGKRWEKNLEDGEQRFHSFFIPKMQKEHGERWEKTHHAEKRVEKNKDFRFDANFKVTLESHLPTIAKASEGSFLELDKGKTSNMDLTQNFEPSSRIFKLSAREPCANDNIADNMAEIDSSPELAHHRSIRSYAISDASCEPMTADTECFEGLSAFERYGDIGMPYTGPNNEDYDSQSSAAGTIAFIKSLYDTTTPRCHSHLFYFACASTLPKCTPGTPVTLTLPCRAMCEEIRAACGDSFTAYGTDWDSQFPCSFYPDNTTDCLQYPDAVTTLQPTPEATSVEDTTTPQDDTTPEGTTAEDGVESTTPTALLGTTTKENTELVTTTPILVTTTPSIGTTTTTTESTTAKDGVESTTPTALLETTTEENTELVTTTPTLVTTAQMESTASTTTTEPLSTTLSPVSTILPTTASLDVTTSKDTTATSNHPATVNIPTTLTPTSASDPTLTTGSTVVGSITTTGATTKTDLTTTSVSTATTESTTATPTSTSGSTTITASTTKASPTTATGPTTTMESTTTTSPIMTADQATTSAPAISTASATTTGLTTIAASTTTTAPTTDSTSIVTTNAMADVTTTTAATSATNPKTTSAPTTTTGPTTPASPTTLAATTALASTTATTTITRADQTTTTELTTDPVSTSAPATTAESTTSTGTAMAGSTTTSQPTTAAGKTTPSPSTTSSMTTATTSTTTTSLTAATATTAVLTASTTVSFVTSGSTTRSTESIDSTVGATIATARPESESQTSSQTQAADNTSENISGTTTQSETTTENTLQVTTHASDATTPNLSTAAASEVVSTLDTGIGTTKLGETTIANTPATNIESTTVAKATEAASTVTSETTQEETTSTSTESTTTNTIVQQTSTIPEPESTTIEGGENVVTTNGATNPTAAILLLTTSEMEDGTKTTLGTISGSSEAIQTQTTTGSSTIAVSATTLGTTQKTTTIKISTAGTSIDQPPTVAPTGASTTETLELTSEAALGGNLAETATSGETGGDMTATSSTTTAMGVETPTIVVTAGDPSTIASTAGTLGATTQGTTYSSTTSKPGTTTAHTSSETTTLLLAPTLATTMVSSGISTTSPTAANVVTSGLAATTSGDVTTSQAGTTAKVLSPFTMKESVDPRVTTESLEISSTSTTRDTSGTVGTSTGPTTSTIVNLVQSTTTTSSMKLVEESTATEPQLATFLPSTTQSTATTPETTQTSSITSTVATSDVPLVTSVSSVPSITKATPATPPEVSTMETTTPESGSMSSYGTFEGTESGVVDTTYTATMSTSAVTGAVEELSSNPLASTTSVDTATTMSETTTTTGEPTTFTTITTDELVVEPVTGIQLETTAGIAGLEKETTSAGTTTTITTTQPTSATKTPETSKPSIGTTDVTTMTSQATTTKMEILVPETPVPEFIETIAFSTTQSSPTETSEDTTSGSTTPIPTNEDVTVTTIDAGTTSNHLPTTPVSDTSEPHTSIQLATKATSPLSTESELASESLGTSNHIEPVSVTGYSTEADLSTFVTTITNNSTTTSSATIEGNVSTPVLLSDITTKTALGSWHAEHETSEKPEPYTTNHSSVTPVHTTNQPTKNSSFLPHTPVGSSRRSISFTTSQGVTSHIIDSALDYRFYGESRTQAEISGDVEIATIGLLNSKESLATNVLSSNAQFVAKPNMPNVTTFIPMTKSSFYVATHNSNSQQLNSVADLTSASDARNATTEPSVPGVTTFFLESETSSVMSSNTQYGTTKPSVSDTPLNSAVSHATNMYFETQTLTTQDNIETSKTDTVAYAAYATTEPSVPNVPPGSNVTDLTSANFEVKTQTVTNQENIKTSKTDTVTYATYATPEPSVPNVPHGSNVTDLTSTNFEVETQSKSTDDNETSKIDTVNSDVPYATTEPSVSNLTTFIPVTESSSSNIPPQGSAVADSSTTSIEAGTHTMTTHSDIILSNATTEPITLDTTTFNPITASSYPNAFPQSSTDADLSAVFNGNNETTAQIDQTSVIPFTETYLDANSEISNKPPSASVHDGSGISNWRQRNFTQKNSKSNFSLIGDFEKKLPIAVHNTSSIEIKSSAIPFFANGPSGFGDFEPSNLPLNSSWPAVENKSKNAKGSGIPRNLSASILNEGSGDPWVDRQTSVSFNAGTQNISEGLSTSSAVLGVSTADFESDLTSMPPVTSSHSKLDLASMSLMTSSDLGPNFKPDFSPTNPITSSTQDSRNVTSSTDDVLQTSSSKTATNMVSKPEMTSSFVTPKSSSVTSSVDVTSLLMTPSSETVLPASSPVCSSLAVMSSASTVTSSGPLTTSSPPMTSSFSPSSGMSSPAMSASSSGISSPAMTSSSGMSSPAMTSSSGISSLSMTSSSGVSSPAMTSSSSGMSSTAMMSSSSIVTSSSSGITSPPSSKLSVESRSMSSPSSSSLETSSSMSSTPTRLQRLSSASGSSAELGSAFDVSSVDATMKSSFVMLDSTAHAETSVFVTSPIIDENEDSASALPTTDATAAILGHTSSSETEAKSEEGQTTEEMMPRHNRATSGAMEHSTSITTLRGETGEVEVVTTTMGHMVQVSTMSEQSTPPSASESQSVPERLETGATTSPTTLSTTQDSTTNQLTTTPVTTDKLDTSTADTTIAPTTTGDTSTEAPATSTATSSANQSTTSTMAASPVPEKTTLHARLTTPVSTPTTKSGTNPTSIRDTTTTMGLVRPSGSTPPTESGLISTTWDPSNASIMDTEETTTSEALSTSTVIECLQERTGNDVDGYITWPMTTTGSTAVSSCPTPSSETATRLCDSGTWQLPDTSTCTALGQTSRELQDLARATIGAANASRIADQILNVTDGEKETLIAYDIANVAGVLRKIADVIPYRENYDITSDVITSVSNVIEAPSEEIKVASMEFSSNSELLDIVDAVSLKLEVAEGEDVFVEAKNVKVVVAGIDRQEEFSGRTFSLSSNSEAGVTSVGTHPSAQASISLPASIGDVVQRENLTRIQFAVYTRTSLFEHVRAGPDVIVGDSPEGNITIYSDNVVSASIGEMKISNLNDDITITLARSNSYFGKGPTCVFYEYPSEGGEGTWSSGGCRVEESTEDKVVCKCSHLTNFAVIMDVYGSAETFDDYQNKILRILTYIGCTLSIFGLLSTLLSYAMFEKLRKEAPAKILICLCAALIGVNVVYLCLQPAYYSNYTTCIAVAALMHYFLLSSLMWMGLEAINMYIALVKVFNTYYRRYMLKMSLVGWGIPLVIVVSAFIVQAATDVQSYEKNNSTEICWLRREVFYGTLVAPFGIIFVLNSIIYCLVLAQLLGMSSKKLKTADSARKRKRPAKRENARKLRGAIGLMALLGLSWGFALAVIDKAALPFAYVFVVFNSSQGFWVFIFHCVLKKEVSKSWKRLVFNKGTLRDGSARWSRFSSSNTRGSRSTTMSSARSMSASSIKTSYLVPKSNSVDKSEVSIGLDSKGLDVVIRSNSSGFLNPVFDDETNPDVPPPPPFPPPDPPSEERVVRMVPRRASELPSNTIATQTDTNLAAASSETASRNSMESLENTSDRGQGHDDVTDCDDIIEDDERRDSVDEHFGVGRPPSRVIAGHREVVMSPSNESGIYSDASVSSTTQLTFSIGDVIRNDFIPHTDDVTESRGHDVISGDNFAIDASVQDDLDMTSILDPTKFENRHESKGGPQKCGSQNPTDFCVTDSGVSAGCSDSAYTDTGSEGPPSRRPQFRAQDSTVSSDSINSSGTSASVTSSGSDLSSSDGSASGGAYPQEDPANNPVPTAHMWRAPLVLRRSDDPIAGTKTENLLQRQPVISGGSSAAVKRALWKKSHKNGAASPPSSFETKDSPPSGRKKKRKLRKTQNETAKTAQKDADVKMTNFSLNRGSFYDGAV